MVFFSSTRSFGQSPKTTGPMEPGQRYGFYLSGTSYSRSLWDKVGYEKYSGYVYGYYESGMVWNLTNIISQSATITSCQLTFHSGIELEGATSNGGIVFTGIPWNFYNNSDAHVVYDQILNGPTYGSIAISNDGQYNISLPIWISAIQGAVQSSTPYIGLGAYNSGPPMKMGTSFNQVYLTINYTLPTPPQPTNLRLTSQTALNFTLAWNAPSGNVTGYKVFKSGSYYGTTTSTNLLITGLCPNTSYPMYVIPYNAYGDGDQSSTGNFSTLAYSISTDGAATVCSSPNKTFTFHNRPSGIDINWTKSDNLAYVSGQGTDSYVVSASTSGSGWVQATLSSGCNPTVPQYPVWVGPPILTVTGDATSDCTYTTHYFYAIADYYANATNFTWDLVPLNGNYLSPYGYNNDHCAITFYNPYSASGYTVRARAQNSCGTSDYGTTSIWIHTCLRFSLSPNPASETVTVTKKVSGAPDGVTDAAIAEDATTIYTIRIIDFYGSLHYSATKSGDSFTFPVSGLKDGQYIVQITDGKNTTSLPLIVKH